MGKAIPSHTPVDLVTGFLGSGKTTLLRRLLADPVLADTAVLINEFGEVGLDHLLLERIDETMVLLQSGCLCCSIRDELAVAMRELLSKRERGLVPPFRRLVIESTGLADPFPILSTIHSEPALKHHFRIGTVIATVDAVNGLAQLGRQFESVKQVAAADRIVITKTDLVAASAVDRVTRELRRINPDAPVISSASVGIDARSLLTPSKAKPARVDRDDETRIASIHARVEGKEAPGIHSNVSSFALVVEQPLDWTEFAIWLTMLLNRRGDDVLRVKGVLNVAGWDRPVALHAVQRLVHPPVHMRAWPDDDRRSRIVFIARGIERRVVERSLAAFNALKYRLRETAISG
jgi:G3E family GTPase